MFVNGATLAMEKVRLCDRESQPTSCLPVCFIQASADIEPQTSSWKSSLKEHDEYACQNPDAFTPVEDCQFIMASVNTVKLRR
jgi:hypothetical protein